MEVQGRLEEIRGLGGQVLAISFTTPAKLAAYLQRHPIAVPAAADPAQAAYRAFELGQASWWNLLSPRVLGRYLRLLLGGWRPRKYEGEDVFQLGGDFVLDERRRLVYAYRSTNPADRPSADELVQAVRDACKTSKCR